MPGGKNASTMLNGRKLIADTFCEIYELVEDKVDDFFWDWQQHKVVSGAIYLIGRHQFKNNINEIRNLAESNTILPILSNPMEGSETMFRQIEGHGILDLVRQGRILVITGGHLPPDIPALFHENFLPKILDYTKNIEAIEEYNTHRTTDRPYKFLFLNGRGRKHRQFLLGALSDVLDQAIWTNLDSAAGEIKVLDSKYEVDFYRNATNLPNHGFIKYQLFNNEWGDIYLNARPYNDSYFSLITETVFDYPYSFRTEKLWKPIAIGHPFIVASSCGYYRDLQKLGFRTFGHLIDESFDLVDNNQQRLEHIARVVKNLCSQDLPAFITAAEETCKYNQQHLAELRLQVRKEFPQRFINFINERS